MNFLKPSRRTYRGGPEHCTPVRRIYMRIDGRVFPIYCSASSRPASGERAAKGRTFGACRGLSIVLADKSRVLAIRPGQFKSSITQG